MTAPPAFPAVPPPGPGGRRAPTWVVVLVTAGVMVAIGIAFVVGVVVGASLNRGGSSMTGGAGSGGSGESATVPSAPSGGGGTLDSCVVGTWEGVEHTEDWTTDQGDAQLSGLSRTITFTADGTETISYDGDEATITAQDKPVKAVFDGEVVYRASTSGSTMSFELVSVEGSVTLDLDGESKVEELKPGVGDVTYTCDDSTLRQEAEGYLSVYRRAG